MPTVRFSGQSIECLDGANLRMVLLRARLPLYNGAARALHCRGLGTCGTCAVRIEGAVSDPTPQERRRLSLPPHRPEVGLRLACQVDVLGDIVVTKHEGFFGQKEGQKEDQKEGHKEGPVVSDVEPGRVIPTIDRNRCEAKEDCVRVCPWDVFEIHPLADEDRADLSLIGKLKARAHGNRQAYAVRAADCHACMKCVEACPEGAITLAPHRPGEA